MKFILSEEDIISKCATKALYFYASWMPFHKKMLIMIEKMEQKNKEIDFMAVDTDHFKGLCRRFSIKSIPTVVIFKNNEEIKRINGLVMTSAFKSAFNDI